MLNLSRLNTIRLLRVITLIISIALMSVSYAYPLSKDSNNTTLKQPTYQDKCQNTEESSTNERCFGKSPEVRAPVPDSPNENNSQEVK